MTSRSTLAFKRTALRLRLHVRVDPHPLVLTLPFQDLLVRDVILMVAPCEVIDGSPIQPGTKTVAKAELESRRHIFIIPTPMSMDESK